MALGCAAAFSLLPGPWQPCRPRVLSEVHIVDYSAGCFALVRVFRVWGLGSLYTYHMEEHARRSQHFAPRAGRLQVSLCQEGSRTSEASFFLSG